MCGSARWRVGSKNRAVGTRRRSCADAISPNPGLTLSVCLAGRQENREYSRQFGSHPGNPGSPHVPMTEATGLNAVARWQMRGNKGFVHG